MAKRGVGKVAHEDAARGGEVSRRRDVKEWGCIIVLLPQAVVKNEPAMFGIDGSIKKRALFFIVIHISYGIDMT